MRRWISSLIALALVAAFVVAAGPGIEEQRFSCHKCRNLKYVTTRNFLFVHDTRTEREEEQFPVPSGHVHEWWLYSTFTSQGIGGWLGSSVGCQPSTYKDGEPTQETTRSTGVALQGNKESTSKKLAWVVDEATDTQRPKSPLRVRIRMEQPVWGEWESARFDYWIENCDVAVRFRDGDKGRGFAGKLLRLCDSQGKVCSWGDKYVAPKEYPPAFGPVVQGSGHGETVSELRRLAIEDFLGPLKAGQYTLQVIVPSGRLMVNDTPNPQLASGLLTFRVVALTDAMQRAIDSVPQDPAGVILEPQARNAKSGVNHQRVEFKLINGSRVPIEYEGYDDDPTSVVFRWEVFTGDGTWREKDPLGWCGNGMMTKRLGPRESAKIAVSVSETPSRIVRFILEVTDAGTNQVRKIVSPGVELVVEKRP